MRCDRLMSGAASYADPKAIHHLDRDPEFLIELPEGVQILTVRVSTVPIGPSGARIEAAGQRF